MAPRPAPAPPTIDALLAHAGLVRGLARNLLYDPDDAEDVAQETWLAAVKRPPRHGASGLGWLARVTRNSAATAIRRRRARTARERATARPEAVASVEEIVSREEIRRRVLVALLGLDPLHRDALLLRFYDGLPPRRVARVLGVPVETARTRIRRGLERMRARLDEEHEGRASEWRGALALWLGRGPAVSWAAIAVVVALGAGTAAWFATRPRTARVGVQVPSEESDAVARAATLRTAEPAVAAATSDVALPSEGTRPTLGVGLARVTGTVHATDGTVPPDARVYAHPVGAREAGMAPGLPRVEVDGETGTWEIDLLDPVRWTLRATAPGFPSKDVRLEGRPADAPIHISLEPGRRLRVRVRNENGAPLLGRHALLVGSAVERPSLSLLPLRDGAIRPDLWQLAEVPSDGLLTLTVGVPEPAYLEYDGQFTDSGAYADPERIALGPGVADVEILLRPSCRVALTLVDARTGGAPRLPSLARVRLVDERTGRTFEPRLGGGPAGLRTWSSIAPGVYTVRVEAQGWRPWSREGVSLARPGAVANLEVRLEADPGVGGIGVTARRPEPAVDPEWLFTAVRLAGTGAPTEVAVPLGPGLEVRLAEGVPASAAIRAVRLTSPDLGALPLLAMEGGRGGGRTDDFSNFPPGRGTVLGPYPVREIRVEVERWDGPVHAWTVRR